MLSKLWSISMMRLKQEEASEIRERPRRSDGNRLLLSEQDAMTKDPKRKCKEKKSKLILKIGRFWMSFDSKFDVTYKDLARKRKIGVVEDSYYGDEGWAGMPCAKDVRGHTNIIKDDEFQITYEGGTKGP